VCEIFLPDRYISVFVTSRKNFDHGILNLKFKCYGMLCQISHLFYEVGFQVIELSQNLVVT